MTDQEVGVLAIGAGPANLALAVALEECGDQALAEDTLVLEQHGQLLDEMHLTNYGGLAPPFLDELYWMLYRQMLLSTLAHRSQDIATDLLARRGVAATVGGA